MQMSSIDVVIPCFQYGRFLRDSVGSVLSQDVDALRVLIIDNASTDDSLDVARGLAAEDKRVNIIAHERNLGPIASCNEGIDWAAADYFMTLDADDLLAPDCLKRAMSIMDEDQGIAFCHGREREISSDDTISNEIVGEQSNAEWRVSSGQEFIRKLCSKGYNFVAYPTVVRRTGIQKSIGYYDPDLTYANDMNMWLRLATRGKVAETAAVQGIRRVHPGQMTQAYREIPVLDLIEHLNNFEHFFRHEGGELPSARSDRATVARRIAFNGLYMACMLMLARRPQQSLRCIRFSLTTYAGLLAQSLRQPVAPDARAWP
jgi:glycosyltransferase involved in cell wall biosynthesis